MHPNDFIEKNNDKIHYYNVCFAGCLKTVNNDQYSW